MLDTLVAIADRFERAGKLPPVATRRVSPHWLITIDTNGTATLSGRFADGDVRPLITPDVGRTSNIQPLLLTDKASYVLGVADEKGEARATKEHNAFVALVHKANAECQNADITHITAFLEHPVLTGMGQIKPDENVAFCNEAGEFPCESTEIRRFWTDALAKKEGITEGICLVCGQQKPVLRILTNKVTIFGQVCQITSFEKTAFRSFGKKQTGNAPICFTCASKATTALNHMLSVREHHATLVYVKRNDSTPDPFASQMAVFWTKEEVRLPDGEMEYDLNAAVTEMLAGDVGFNAPVPELAQLEALLQVPWTASTSASYLNTNGFCLAVLSASKARLVVREWLDVPLDALRHSLTRYITATRIVGPQGEAPRPFPVPALLAAVGRQETQRAKMRKLDPNWTRGLLRTAYMSVPPPPALLNAALAQFSKPTYLTAAKEEDRRIVHCLASLLKLLLTYGKEETEPMSTLDDEPAYLCGRVLGIVEEMQRRSSSSRVNKLLVERFFAKGMNAPTVALSELAELAETAYLPKIRKNRQGFGTLQEKFTQTMGRIATQGGVSRTFTSSQRAAFALGLYIQRAEFAQGRTAPQGAGE